MGALCVYGCQSGKAVNFAQVHYTKPTPKVWVQGYVRDWLSDSTEALLDFVVVFSRRLPDNSIERTVDLSTPKTGKYRVLLTGGEYEVDVKLPKYNCVLSTELYAVSDRLTDTLVHKEFYVQQGCGDTVDCSGGCSRGWRRSYIKIK